MADQELDEVDRVMTQGSPHEILRLKQKLLKNLDELTKRRRQKTSIKKSFLDFKEGVGSVGRLVLDEEQRLERASEASSSYDAVSEEPSWELKNTFTQFITGQTASFKSAVRVAAFQSGEIVVAETKKNCLIDFLMRKETSKTKPKSVLIPQSCRYLKHLEGLAVNTKDQIIVQDGDQIKIFDRNYKMISEFTPGYRPSCLAVDDNDLNAAAAELQWVLDNGAIDEVRIQARLRLAKVLLAEGQMDEAMKLTVGENKGYSAAFSEVKGDILAAQGDSVGALSVYQQARDIAATGEGGQSLLINLKIQQLEKAQQSDENQTGNDESAANDSAKKGDV